MLPYEVKIIGNETQSDNILYKLRIVDQHTMEHREIRVRYSLLFELHSQLQEHNPKYQMPQFPKKEFFKTLFGDNKVIKQREQMLGEYFANLIKCPPPINKLLIEFLKEGVDAIRLQELQREVNSKSELYKTLKFERVLKKSQYGKTTLMSSQGKKIIFHKFYVPQHSCEQLFNQYQRTHQTINDFTYIAQVHSIFFIRPKANLIDSMFGSGKQPKSSRKSNIFTQLYPLMQSKIEAVKIFSLEDFEGLNLEAIINERREKKLKFSIDELLNIIQKLLLAILYLHKRNIITNRIFATSILIQNDNLKLTGIYEPNERFKEKTLLEGHATRTEQEFDIIYYPPEKLNQQCLTQNFNPIKVDAWQFGICILKCALLAKNRDLEGIQSYNSVNKFIKQVQQIYGNEISEIIEMSLKNNYQERADLKQLNFLANQTSLMPFSAQYLKQPKQQIGFLRINSLAQEEFKNITEQIRKAQIFSVRLNLNNQIVDNKAIDLLLQVFGDFAEVRDFSFILSRSQNLNVSSLFCSISQLKQLKLLSVDIKSVFISQDDISYSVELLKELNTLQRLIIDCSEKYR